MRPTRRVLFTASLVVLVVLGLTPLHSVEFAEAAPDVVEAEVELSETELDLTVDARRTEPVEAPITFTGLWAELDEPADEILVRTSEDGETWSDWSAVETLDADDGPDDGTDEDRGSKDERRTSELLIAEESNHLQLEVPDEVGEVRVHLADASGANDSLWVRVGRWLSRSGAPAEASSGPDWVVPRSEWGANEAATGSTREASGGVRMAVVHHTASRSDYRRDEVPNQLRIIQNYHIGLGWSDVGYNALIDRFGRVYEGRRGGLDRAVIGAHARNFNTGSFGVAVIGNFEHQQAPQAAIDSLGRIIGYKAGLHGFDPHGTVEVNGRSRPTVVGHQDVGNTACPGLIQHRLPDIRDHATQLAATHGHAFSDIDARSEHGAAILSLYADGVIAGCEPGRFCPRRDLTRAQAASLIYRALGLPHGDGSGFTDVTRGETHEQAIGAVASHGIVEGYADGSFRPREPLTREQMASFLARALELRAPGEPSPRFSDVTPGSTHGGNIYAIRDAGITQGCARQGAFCPRDHITRQQMASFVHRMLGVLAGTDDEDEGDIEDEDGGLGAEDGDA